MITISHCRSFLITLAVGALATSAASQPAQEGLWLREVFAPGRQYHVSTRVELSGVLMLPADKNSAARTLSVMGESAVEYDERVLGVERAGRVDKSIRVYRRDDFRRKVGAESQEQTIRAAVRRMVVLRTGSTAAPFSPDGPLTWGEIDLVRTDVFTPDLVGLLPDRAVRPADRWTASSEAIRALTDLDRIEEGQISCRLQEITTMEGRRYARVAFDGSVQGVNEDGPNRQVLDGSFFFDLGSAHLSYLSLKGTHIMLDKDGKDVGRVQGQFVLTRQVEHRSADLEDPALQGVGLEANADNTLLLYDNPAAGVRFLHSRRWRVAGVRGRQVALDEARGSGLLITIESPTKVPTGEQFRAESSAYLRQQRMKILREDPVHALAGAAGALEHFTLKIDEGNRPVDMDYYVTRQPAGGATLAARLLAADAPELAKDVERIAHSVTVTGQPTR